MLLEKIKLDALEARKAHKTDTATLLTTLYSEASMVGKNNGNRMSTDIEVLAVIEKFVKNANEIQEIFLRTNKETCNIVSEILILSSYLPKKLTQEELKLAIRKIVDNTEKENQKMGSIMAILKDLHGGKYDGKLASSIVKEMLTV